MAFSNLTPQVPTRAGTTITFASADGVNGNSFSNNGRRILRFKNSGSETTATVLFGKTIDGIDTEAGRDITIPATSGDITTAVWPSDYTQPDGKVHITYSSATGVTVAVIEV